LSHNSKIALGMAKKAVARSGEISEAIMKDHNTANTGSQACFASPGKRIF
jgi:hypothetical protein